MKKQTTTKTQPAMQGNKATYTARFDDGKICYQSQPDGNLFGQLPLGAHMRKDDLGAMGRTDGGDPWDGARFHLESGRIITVTRDAFKHIAISKYGWGQSPNPLKAICICKRNTPRGKRTGEIKLYRATEDTVVFGDGSWEYPVGQKPELLTPIPS